jgi:hypothetical protein
MLHTPGPWHIDGDVAKSRKLAIYNGTRRTSRTLVAYTMPHAEAEGNAHLIVAAPEMLEALKKLSKLCEELGDAGYVHKDSLKPIEWPPDGFLALAKAAILKAEGL